MYRASLSGRAEETTGLKPFGGLVTQLTTADACAGERCITAAHAEVVSVAAFLGGPPHHPVPSVPPRATGPAYLRKLPHTVYTTRMSTQHLALTC